MNAQTMTYLEAIRDALRVKLREDEKVLLLGEDIGVYGGAFGVTATLLEEFGLARVRDTPISELGMTGVAVGAALTGMRPDRKSTRLNSSHVSISYAVFCLKKNKLSRLSASIN